MGSGFAKRKKEAKMMQEQFGKMQSQMQRKYVNQKYKAKYNTGIQSKMQSDMIKHECKGKYKAESPSKAHSKKYKADDHLR